MKTGKQKITWPAIAAFLIMAAGIISCIVLAGVITHFIIKFW